jgi:ATP-binding cassette subfamily F protein uup
VVNGRARHVVSYMGDFLCPAEQARTPVRVLSGGERGRLMLARALARASNLLVLDEPTNDLDLETLDLLQELLTDYQGTVLLVSHDRDFLDRVVTSVVASEGDGRWIEYAGGYTDMLAQRGAARATAGKPPAAERASSEARMVAPAAPAKRKLSFKEKHALDALPKSIEAWAAEAGRLEARLADPGLYARDRADFEATGTAIAALRAKIAAAEDEWLALELLRTELEG